MSVVIAGMAFLSPLGSDLAEFWSSLLQGKSAISRLPEHLRVGGCGVGVQVDAETPVLRRHDPRPRAVELARLAASKAWEMSTPRVHPERIGLVYGTGIGNVDLAEAALGWIADGRTLSPSTAFRTFSHAATCEIASDLDIRGPILTVTSGCNSGADAMGVALDWLHMRKADVVLVGGSEAELVPGFLRVMGAARALTTKFNDTPEDASRPFDTGRDGNVPGEGAAFLVLERQGTSGAVKPLLTGVATRAAGRRKPYDPGSPLFDTDSYWRAMSAALQEAGLNENQLSAISANGSSSVFYDPLEAAALKKLLGSRVSEVPTFSIKGSLGQCGAVTPVIQTIASVLALENQVLPPTRNCTEIDQSCKFLSISDQPRKCNLSNVLNNATGFGGFYFSSWVVSLGRPE